MIELTRDSAIEAPEMVDLFSIDGVTYQIPAKPRMNVALRYLWHARQHGVDRAAAELLEALLGEQGFAALVEYDDLTPEQFQAIMAAAQKVTMGALEQLSGEAGRGSSK